MRIDRVKLTTELARQYMTTKRLSEITGVSRATISNIKNGKTCAEPTAKRIAKGLGIELIDIVEGE